MSEEVMREIRDLLRLIAEPHIAARDKTRRESLRKIVGTSQKKRAAVPLLDGGHTQSEICKKIGIAKGQLSTFVSELRKAELLKPDGEPALAIQIPDSFFDHESD